MACIITSPERERGRTNPSLALGAGRNEKSPSTARRWTRIAWIRFGRLVAPAAAAAVAAAAATAAAVAAAAATTAAAFLRTRFVDGQRPAVDLIAVHRLDGGLSLGVAAHLDEAEPLGTAGVAVHDHLRRLHGAVGLEHLLQIAVTDTVGQVAHVQF